MNPDFIRPDPQNRGHVVSQCCVKRVLISDHIMADTVAFEGAKEHMIAEMDQQVLKEHGLRPIQPTVIKERPRTVIDVPDPFGMHPFMIIGRYAKETDEL